MERKVYLILSDTGTLLTRMIRLYTKKQYNHASLSFDPLFSEIYSFGRKKPRNPFIGGFVKESCDSGLMKNADCLIFNSTISEDQYQRIMQFIKEIEAEKENYRYNLLGLFAIALNKNLERKKAYFCSQFVATALKEARVIELDKHPAFITPYDLQQAPQFHFLYQGNFAEYKQDTDVYRSFSKQSTKIGLLRTKLMHACSFFLGI